jgi:hypothetical protein
VSTFTGKLGVFETSLIADPIGPCGAAACFTQSQVTGCSSTRRSRYVIGQIIGASNYDIGHLALGQPGGNRSGANSGAPISLGGNLTLHIKITDRGEQGTNDTLGITLWVATSYSSHPSGVARRPSKRSSEVATWSSTKPIDGPLT